jgi:hypothetical protein
MKTEEIGLAIKEAERFIKLAKNLLEQKKKIKWEHGGNTYYNSAPKESGATRRASLDLTRQLAQMRKP